MSFCTCTEYGVFNPYCLLFSKLKKNKKDFISLVVDAANMY